MDRYSAYFIAEGCKSMPFAYICGQLHSVNNEPVDGARVENKIFTRSDLFMIMAKGHSICGS